MALGLAMVVTTILLATATLVTLLLFHFPLTGQTPSHPRHQNTVRVLMVLAAGMSRGRLDLGTTSRFPAWVSSFTTKTGRP